MSREILRFFITKYQISIFLRFSSFFSIMLNINFRFSAYKQNPSRRFIPRSAAFAPISYPKAEANIPFSPFRVPPQSETTGKHQPSDGTQIQKNVKKSKFALAYTKKVCYTITC